MNNNVRLTFRLSEAQRRALEAIADHRQVSVSEVARQAIQREIERPDVIMWRDSAGEIKNKYHEAQQ